MSRSVALAGGERCSAGDKGKVFENGHAATCGLIASHASQRAAPAARIQQPAPSRSEPGKEAQRLKTPAGSMRVTLKMADTAAIAHMPMVTPNNAAPSPGVMTMLSVVSCDAEITSSESAMPMV